MKRCKLASIALLLGITSFINLFGLEKGIVAIIVGWLAIREIKEEPLLKGKRMAWAGLILGVLSILTIIILLVWKGPHLIQQLRLLQKIK